MPQTLAELKASSPAYADMSDMEFASRVYRKHYAEQMSFPEFASRVGFDPYGKSDPTEGMSGTEKFLAGMGKAFVDTGEGLQQIYANVADKIAPRDQSRSAEIERSIAERRRLDAPLMDTGAGLAGNVIGQVAQMAVPLGGGARAAAMFGRAAPYAGAATRGALFGGAQGTVDGESRTDNAVVGGLAGLVGQGIASGSGAVARGAVRRLEAPAQRLAEMADSVGIRLGLPQLSENQFIRTVANQLERLPFSGATKRNRANQEAFNRAVGKTFGADEAALTPDKFGAARDRLSQQFDTLTERNDLSVTADTIRRLGVLRSEVDRLGGTDTARMVRAWTDELLSKMRPDGTIPGKAYQSFDSRIGKVIKSGGEPAHYLGQLREFAREAMDSSISAGDRNAWNLLRRQWAAMKTVEPLVAKSPDGNISPQALMGRVTADKSGKVRMASDRGGDIGDLARIGQRFMRASPDSGTADRALVNLAVGGGLYDAQRRGWIEPQTAMMIGGGLLANRMLGNALNSRALAMGDSVPLNGLARLLAPAPRALPAVANASSLPVLIQGGRVATPEDIERDRQIVEQFRKGR